MKTLKREQLFIIKAFLSGLKERINESAYPELVELQYDFKKNRYHLTAKVIMTLTSENVFECGDTHKLIGHYLIDSVAEYSANRVQVCCRPTEYYWYASPNELVTDTAIIEHIVSPFINLKGGVVPCVEGEEGVVEAVGVEAVESMSECQEAESECSDYFPCNDSPFSNASLE